jgi:hypothetical protein
VSITIERGIKRPLRGRDFHAALDRMQPGDSFMVDTLSQRRLALVVAKRGGFNVRSAHIPDRIYKGGHYRIWLEGKTND